MIPDLWKFPLLSVLLVSFVVSSQISKDPLSLVLDKGDCTIVIYDGGKTDTIKNVVTNLNDIQQRHHEFSSFTVIDHPMSISAITDVSLCLVGISDLSQVNMLQEVMFPSYHRQLIVIDDTIDGGDTVDFEVNKFHHPIMILREGISIDKMYIMCHRQRRLKLNVFRKDVKKWTSPLNVQSLELERICNDNHHPLFGKKISASASSNRPAVLLDENNNILPGGILTDLLGAIGDHYGFQYNMDMSAAPFIFLPNGTLGGSLGDVIYGDYDVTMEQALIVANSFGNPTRYTYNLILAFIEFKPIQIDKYLNIMHPLDTYTWMLLLLSLLAVSITLFFLSLKYTSLKIKTKFELLNNLEMSYGILFCEYHNHRSMHKSLNKSFLFHNTRLLWVVASMFLSMAFVGNLKSSLIRQTYTEKTQTLDEMIDKDMFVTMSAVLAGYIRNSAFDNAFNQRLIHHVEKRNSFVEDVNTIHDQVAPMLKYGYGSTFHMMEIFIKTLQNDYIKERKPFPFVIIPEKYMVMTHAMILKRYDPRVEYFNSVIDYLKDCGLIEAFRQKHFPSKSLKDRDETTEEPLVFEHFVLPFILLACGLGLATIKILIEGKYFCKTEQ